MNINQVNPQKILIVNIFGIGDVLFNTPLIQNLVCNFPNARIDYIANKRVAPMLESYDRVEKVFVYERDEYVMVQRRSKTEFINKVRAFISEVKTEQYDVLFDFSMNRMFNIISSMTGIKYRVGFNYKNRSPLLTHGMKLAGFERKHVVQFYLDLLKELDLAVKDYGLEMSVSQADMDWAARYLKKAGISVDKPIIGLLPGGGSSWGASADLKRWPVAKYIKLIDKIVENFSAQIILMGDKKEKSLCAEIVQSCPNVIKAFGQTSLGQLSALLKNCHCLVCNDGGPLHMAVALGTKTVSIFGPVDEQVYGPWMKKDSHHVVCADIPCRPCYKRFRMTDCQHMTCLHNIEIDSVLNTLKKAI